MVYKSTNFTMKIHLNENSLTLNINMMYCYYTEISIINIVIQKRAKLQYFINKMRTFLMPFEGQNYRFFPGPISQAIVNLNYLHQSAVFADTIFAHLELIQSGFWFVMHIVEKPKHES